MKICNSYVNEILHTYFSKKYNIGLRSKRFQVLKYLWLHMEYVHINIVLDPFRMGWTCRHAFITQCAEMIDLAWQKIQFSVAFPPT
jgi:hypothetical protein